MSHGLQELISYNLEKSSDLGSTDESGLAAGSVSQVVLPPLTPSVFDIRHSVAGAVSYEIPAPAWGRVGTALLKGWAIDGLVRVSSAWPINVTISEVSPVFGAYDTQPEIRSRVTLLDSGSEGTGGQSIESGCIYTSSSRRDRKIPRNSLRSSFSINQTDLALRRRFNLTERVKLDVRAEYFNVFNHPMFGAPGSSLAPFTLWGNGSTAVPFFGKIAPGYTTNVAWGGGVVGGQSAQYAVGGPRSAQFTLKLHF